MKKIFFSTGEGFYSVNSVSQIMNLTKKGNFDYGFCRKSSAKYRKKNLWFQGYYFFTYINLYVRAYVRGLFTCMYMPTAQQTGHIFRQMYKKCANQLSITHSNVSAYHLGDWVLNKRTISMYPASEEWSFSPKEKAILFSNWEQFCKILLFNICSVLSFVKTDKLFSRFINGTYCSSRGSKQKKV